MKKQTFGAPIRERPGYSRSIAAEERVGTGCAGCSLQSLRSQTPLAAGFLVSRVPPATNYKLQSAEYHTHSRVARFTPPPGVRQRVRLGLGRFFWFLAPPVRPFGFFGFGFVLLHPFVVEDSQRCTTAAIPSRNSPNDVRPQLIGNLRAT